MNVKFTQLYWFNGFLHALDEDGFVWQLRGSFEEPYWHELPHAVRNTPEQKESGNVIKSKTPEQIRHDNFIKLQKEQDE